jgi:hypothetical protein
VSDETTTYAPAWREYRRRLFWFLGAFVGGGVAIPIVHGVLGFTAKSNEDMKQPAYYVPMGIWVVLCLTTSTRLVRWRCPHCGGFFFHSFLWSNLFARECSHCALPKYATGPDGSPSPRP